MAIATGIIRAACNTSTGTQDFRDPNMTATPNAAMFIVTSATADGAAAADSIFCLGATDGTNEWSYGGSADDALGTTVTKRRAMNDKCIYIITPATGGVDGEADFSSWLSDAGSGAGVQINWTAAPSAAFLLTVILFSVDNAQAGTYACNGTVGNTTTVTTGFQPTLLLGGSNGLTFGDSGVTNFYNSLGACDDALNQKCTVYFDRNGRGTTELRARRVSNRFACELTWAGTNWESEITSITATTFVATQRVNGSSDEVGYLALDTGTAATWVGAADSPTSTGNQSITAPAFQPQMVFIGTSLVEAEDTQYQDSRAGGFGLSVFDANSEYSNTVSSEDGVGTSNAQSLSDNTAVNQPDHQGTALCTAAFVSMDANGWTLNHTAVAATAKKWWAVAIETDVVTSPSTKYPTSATSRQLQVGAGLWVDPSNVYADDGNYAYVLGDVVDASALEIKGFGFNIPTDKVVYGVEVTVKHRAGTTPFQDDPVKDKRVQLKYGDSIYWNPITGVDLSQNKASGASWDTTWETITYGSNIDLWKFDLSVARVNDSSFGVLLQPDNYSGGAIYYEAQVDYVSITVYFGDPSASSIFSLDSVTQTAVFGGLLVR